ncbi:MAG: ABC transporter permease [Anaerolineae bacterium]|nr:ABC transporter permease [Anaerolineae bacterium]
MKKLWIIGFKDVMLTFRDRPALMFMLLAPFLLTLGLGAATGRFSGGNSSGVSDISVVLVNLDRAQLGDALVEVFRSAELAELIAPSEVDSVEAARLLIDEDKAAAAVIVPAGFTASIIPTADETQPGPSRRVEIYANPTRPTSAGVIQTIVEEFLAQVEIGKIGGEVALTMLLESGRLSPDPQAIAQIGSNLGERIAGEGQAASAIPLRKIANGSQAVNFDILAYMAPSMALMFLMYTVSYGGRSILIERNRGTLPRMLVSPTATAQILGGKVLGIWLTGAAQVGILVLGSTLLFGLDWGDPLGVVVLILAAVFGATGWGMLLTAFGRTPGQVAAVGSALMLTFGILGGNFIDLNTMPEAVRWISRITPNAWGLDGFTTLALGGGLADVLRPILALLAMGVVLFTVSVFAFNRRGIAQR